MTPVVLRPYYEHAGITIYHGDCFELLACVAADIVVTDPPYGIGFAGQPTKWQRRAGKSAERWDDNAPDLTPVLKAAVDAACVWGGNYFPLPVSRGWLVWTKPDAPPSMGSVELAWTSRDQNARYISHSISATNSERLGHPTQKPLRVMRWSIQAMPDGTILDPFMGSGTTLRAAKDLGRKAIGIEIEERYCEIAAKRLAQEVFDFS